MKKKTNTLLIAAFGILAATGIVLVIVFRTMIDVM
jgi:hypothetical protein